MRVTRASCAGSKILLLGAALVALALGADAQELACPEDAVACEPDIGWVEGPAGPMLADFNWAGEVPVIEGDILVELATSESLAGIGIESAIRPDTTWPGGVIPFAVDPTLNAGWRVGIAIEHFEALTSLRFVVRTDEVDYVEFVPSTGCASYVGRIGGRQRIWLAPACSTGNTIHEIGHAVGLWHEQSRQDRDEHVVIHLDRILINRVGNFDVYPDGLDSGAYDIGSIMHYPPLAFSASGLPTIEAIVPPPPGVVMGQRNGLSEGDLAGIFALYDETTASEAPANDGWIQAASIEAGDVVGTLAGASPDGSDVCSSGGTPDVWYRFQAPRAGRLQASTCRTYLETGVDTLLSVHAMGAPYESDQCNDAWSEAAEPSVCANIDGAAPEDSSIAVDLVAGQTAFLRVSRAADSLDGDFALQVRFEASAAQPTGGCGIIGFELLAVLPLGFVGLRGRAPSLSSPHLRRPSSDQRRPRAALRRG